MTKTAQLKYNVGDIVFTFDDSWQIKKFQIGYIRIGANHPEIGSRMVVYFDAEGNEYLDLWTFKSADECKKCMISKLEQFYTETMERCIND